MFEVAAAAFDRGVLELNQLAETALEEVMGLMGYPSLRKHYATRRSCERRIASRPQRGRETTNQTEQQLTLGLPEISDRQLQIALAVIDVVFEREREINRGAMLRNEAFAL